jgi:hypothetical protein
LVSTQQFFPPFIGIPGFIGAGVDFGGFGIFDPDPLVVVVPRPPRAAIMSLK